MLLLQRTAGNKAVAGLVAQRRAGKAGGSGSVQETVAGAAFQAELSRVLAGLPELGQAIPEPSRIEQVGQEAQEDAEVLKVAKGRPALGSVAERVVSGPVAPPQKAPEPDAAPKAQAGPKADAGPAAAAPKKGFWAGIGSSISSFFSSKKKYAQSDVGQAEIGDGLETVAKGGYAAATTGGSLLGQTGNAASLIGQTAVAASPAVVSIAHIVPIVGLFLAPLTMCLNGFQAGKAWNRAAQLEELIEKADGTARNLGHDPLIVAAVRGAMEQKYEQAKRKALTAVASLLSLTGGLLLLTATLASNPVGWAIGVGLALIGGAYGFYLSARAIYRYFKKKNKGEKRKAITAALLKGVIDGDPLAEQAVRELGLNPNMVKQPGGDKMLFKRLTTL
jgi:hypothetical protein